MSAFEKFCCTNERNVYYYSVSNRRFRLLFSEQKSRPPRRGDVAIAPKPPRRAFWLRWCGCCPVHRQQQSIDLLDLICRAAVISATYLYRLPSPSCQSAEISRLTPNENPYNFLETNLRRQHLEKC